MPWYERLRPVSMQRVALLAPTESVRDLLVAVADEGAVDFDDPNSGGGQAAAAPPGTRSTRPASEGTGAALALFRPQLDDLERAGRFDLIAGETQLEQRAAQASTSGRVAGLAGWMPAGRVARLAERVSPFGGAVVPLEPPAGMEPPTLLPQEGPAREFAPLIDTYGTVPYTDVDPSLLAGIAYVVMFGIMFADVGHGALLVVVAAAVRLQWWRRLSGLRRVWVFLAGAGAASMVFGGLYGEFFGPTKVIPVVWLAPLDHPVPLLGAAVGFGAVLLGGAYALGSVNRFREGGWRQAAYAPSGLAGGALFLGLGIGAGGVYFDLVWLDLVGGMVALAGLSVAYVGMFAAAGGGGAGAAEAGVELFDMIVRLLSNLVSFARLAAFGLTHAALGKIVWDGTVGLAKHGPGGVVGAVLVFAAGNVLAFALEGLVAGIQALRLEYYELFSRIFDRTGRPYRPWHVPIDSTEMPC